MKDAILAKLEESFQIAEKYYGRTFQRPVKIVWETEKTRAGYCHFGRKEFGFNPILAAENAEDFIRTTVPHEVAHWIDKEVYGYQRTRSGRRVVHGKTWKRIMIDVFGLDPDRCHEYDVVSVKTRTRVVIRAFEYTCPCNKTYNLTSVRHNRILKGTTYACKSCGGRLRLVSAKTPMEIQMETLQKKIDFLQAQKDAKKI